MPRWSPRAASGSHDQELGYRVILTAIKHALCRARWARGAGGAVSQRARDTCSGARSAC